MSSGPGGVANKVCPSGGDFATISAATCWAPPGRFSMTTGRDDTWHQVCGDSGWKRHDHSDRARGVTVLCTAQAWERGAESCDKENVLQSRDGASHSDSSDCRRVCASCRSHYVCDQVVAVLRQSPHVSASHVDARVDRAPHLGRMSWSQAVTPCRPSRKAAICAPPDAPAHK